MEWANVIAALADGHRIKPHAIKTECLYALGLVGFATVDTLKQGKP